MLVLSFMNRRGYVMCLDVIGSLIGEWKVIINERIFWYVRVGDNFMIWRSEREICLVWFNKR